MKVDFVTVLNEALEKKTLHASNAILIAVEIALVGESLGQLKT